MSGFIDLHCHWVAGIDDGPDDWKQSQHMLRDLADIGFEMVVATPHMRPGLYDNTREQIAEAYAQTLAHLDAERDRMPRVALSCEHLLDDLVLQRLLRDEGLPYPDSDAVLIELGYGIVPAMVRRPLFELRRHKLRPILAHPERYESAWKDPEEVASLETYGAVMLLDILSLVGTYGRKVRKTAERWLEEGLYYAACTDSHRVKHVELVPKAIERLQSLVGEEETAFLLRDGPLQILAGEVQL